MLPSQPRPPNRKGVGGAWVVSRGGSSLGTILLWGSEGEVVIGVSWTLPPPRRRVHPGGPLDGLPGHPDGRRHDLCVVSTRLYDLSCHPDPPLVMSTQVQSDLPAPRSRTVQSDQKELRLYSPRSGQKGLSRTGIFWSETARPWGGTERDPGPRTRLWEFTGN